VIPPWQWWLSVSGQGFAAGGQQEPIPIVAAEVDLVRFGRLADALGFGAAHDRHNADRMFEQPCEGYGDAAGSAGFGDGVQRGINRSTR